MKYFLFIWISVVLSAQPLSQKKHFTYQDSLRGANNEHRSFWDVKHYAISVEPFFEQKRIEGSVIIELTAVENKKKPTFQIDLQTPMEITAYGLQSGSRDTILSKKHYQSIENNSNIQREGNVYWITFNQKIRKGENYLLYLNFEGFPTEAENAPWDGGWVFAHDDKGRPWMSVACQGLGASVWFPNKDYLGDEPDEGVTLSIKTPKELVGVGNGRLKSTDEEDGKKVFVWEVTKSINNYNIIPNIGHYQEIKDSLITENGTLDLHYWVLDYHVEKAKQHFQQVKPMMHCFEENIGPYPFYEDSYKLIETPYLGMEHQSGIAYGNFFLPGYMGGDLSRTGHGLSFDFIIIHESGHEWFGNSISVEDIADLWIHEAFTTYTEVLYLECTKGLEAADEYVVGLQKIIGNDRPIIGLYGVNHEGSGDMYFKGANIIHMIRQLMEDDEKFHEMLRALYQKFHHSVVKTAEIEKFISDYTKKDLTAFFNQYLREKNYPTLEIKKENKHWYYRYSNVVEGFDMPLRLDNGKWIFPTSNWSNKNNEKYHTFKLDPQFLVNLKR